ncbi:MAG: glycosyltransferase [Chloroflexota bacterium]|nr:glycosyltransferase [Chloroflexota bacterium]
MARLASRRTRAPRSTIDGPLLSVIVTSYRLDRLADIKELLDSLQTQTYTNLDVLFVGEGTRDLGREVAAYGRQRGLANLRVLFNDGPTGLAPARNLGIEHARGEIIAFLDDDAIALPDWAEETVKSFAADESVIGLTGPALPRWEGEAMEWFPTEFYWIISCSAWFDAEGVRTVRNAWGMNMAFRREAFDHCSFDERLGGNMGAADGSKLGLLGEDTLFSMRIRRETGRPIIYNPRVKVFHRVYAYRFKPRFVRRRAFWEGYTKAWLRKLHRQDGGLAADDLATEYRLLRRIALGFFPRVMVGFAREPRRSWRQLCLAIDALGHVALGYASASAGPLGRALCRRYGR